MTCRVSRLPATKLTLSLANGEAGLKQDQDPDAQQQSLSQTLSLTLLCLCRFGRFPASLTLHVIISGLVAMCLTLFFKYMARPGVGVRTVKRDKNGTPVVQDGQVCFLAAARVLNPKP